MPNKRAADKLHSSITLHKDIFAALDIIAKKTDRSRNKVIEILLMNELGNYNEKDGLKLTSDTAKARIKKIANGNSMS